MNIIKLKGCKRCSGDLVAERDYEGLRIICLQCGADYTPLPTPVKKTMTTKRVYAHSR